MDSKFDDSQNSQDGKPQTQAVAKKLLVQAVGKKDGNSSWSSNYFMHPFLIETRGPDGNFSTFGVSLIIFRAQSRALFVGPRFTAKVVES